jgi:hypothetical protein
MLPHEKPCLFRNTALRLECCTDELESPVWSVIPWDNEAEERAMHEVRQWCERYIAAYDDHYGNNVTDE